MKLTKLLEQARDVANRIKALDTAWHKEMPPTDPQPQDYIQAEFDIADAISRLDEFIAFLEAHNGSR